MLERLLKLAEIMAADGDVEGLKSLDRRLAGYIKREAHFTPNNDGKTPNPWRRNMDYAPWENSPYYGSVSEFMKKFPGGIKDWVAWRKENREERHKKWDINKRKAYVLSVMKKGELDYDDLSGEYEPTKEEREHAEMPASNEEREKAFDLLLKNIEMIKEMADLSDEEIKAWLENKYGQTGMAAEDEGEDTRPTLDETLGKISDPLKKFDLLQALVNKELLSYKFPQDGTQEEKARHIENLKQINQQIQSIKEEFGVKENIRFDDVAAADDDVETYVGPIEKETVENENYRKVIFTGKHSQLVLMTLKAGEEIGEEVHGSIDQFFRVEEGEGTFTLSGEENKVGADEAIIIPAGTKHNVKNEGDGELKLYTIYSPPNHPKDTVHKTKEDDKGHEKHAHYVPEGGDDVSKFEKEPHLYSGEMDKFKSIEDYLSKYHSSQDVKDAAFGAAKDFVRYWRKLLKKDVKKDR